LNFETLEWLDQNRQLATPYHRGAFFPGEGVGAVALASESMAQRYKWTTLGRVRGIGTAIEANKIKTDTVCVGEGLTACIRKAVSGAQFPDEAIEGIICDLNGERYRAEEWGFALLRLPQVFSDPTGYDLPTSCWGDVGAASGPLAMCIAVNAAQKGYAKGSRYLIWNSSEGGQRAAAFLELNMRRNGDKS
jgi:3-oxoacyl-[acyl-carrier-protein] synthase-1